MLPIPPNCCEDKTARENERGVSLAFPAFLPLCAKKGHCQGKGRRSEEGGRVPASPNLTARLPVIQPVKGCNTHMKTQFCCNALVCTSYCMKVAC